MSRLNALKHGLLSSEILLWSESHQDLEALRKGLRAELHPATALEEILVDRVVSCVWRLKRALRAERATAELSAHRVNSEDWQGNKRNPVVVGPERTQASVNPHTDGVLRYEMTIERQLYRALKELSALQALRGLLRGRQHAQEPPETPQE